MLDNWRKSWVGALILAWLVTGCADTQTSEMPEAASLAVKPKLMAGSKAPSEKCGQTTSADECRVLNFPEAKSLERTFWLHLPPNLKPGAPLLVVLHGFSSSKQPAEDAARYFDARRFADENGYVAVFPNGALLANFRFWDAFSDCCTDAGFAEYINGIDSVGFLSRLIDGMLDEFQLDPKRVYLMGHSNGSLMSNRLACEISPKLTAIVTVAGPLPGAPSLCQPKSPVAVWHIHGTGDTTVPFNGPNAPDGLLTLLVTELLTVLNRTSEKASDFLEAVRLNTRFASAPDSVKHWATLNECGPEVQTKAPVSFTLADDVNQIEAGPKRTGITNIYSHCQKAPVQWTVIEGASHTPRYDMTTLHPALVEFFGKVKKP